MSSLLEQAIIDATALKEAALKNAEAAVLEKYAPEIKRAVETLLEQEEEDPFAMAGVEEPPADLAMEEPPADADVDAPLASTEGEKMCGCPDEDDATVVTVDFSTMMDNADDAESEEPAEDQEDLAQAAGFPLQEDAQVELSNELLQTIINELSSDNEESLEEGEDGPCPNEPAEEDSEEEDDTSALPGLDEATLTDVVEKLVVDMAATKSGWLGGSRTDAVYETELELASSQSTDFQEENEDLKKAVEELQEKLSNYHFTIKEMKQKLEETNLTNARLLYANRILGSTSLNERQKNKLVEAISNAGSVKEAKVIYETLKSTVGSTPDRRGPQSLREAVARPSSIMSVRENRNKTADPAAERMRILAGIKK